MKRNINTLIKESVRKQLLEYVQPSFKVNTFKQISDSNNLDVLKQYCDEYLNGQIGSGNTRTVYDYTDDMVLKIANCPEGRYQNEQEYQIYKVISNNPLLPRIYDVDTENYNWLLSESVLPAKRDDFLKILGIPYAGTNKNVKDETWKPTNPEDRWDYSDYENAEQPYDDLEEDDEGEISYLGFLAWYEDYCDDNLEEWEAYETEQYRKLIWTNDWFQNLLELFEVQKPEEFFIENLGIAMRDGKPMIVVLDIGDDSDIN